MNTLPDSTDESLFSNLAINPSSIYISDIPNVLKCYIEFKNIPDLTGYQIESAILNDGIEPLSISTIPGDHDGDGIEDFMIEYNPNDILTQIIEGELIMYIFGNVTLPTSNISFYSAASSIMVYGEPPNIPSVPSGPSTALQNLSYTFVSTTVDPEDSFIYYLFDWGDGTSSGYVGPYISGEEGSAYHTWTATGNYNISVKARDIWGQESDWSPSFTVSIKYDAYNDPPSSEL